MPRAFDGTWSTGGRRIRIEDMGDRHLTNAIRWLTDKGDQDKPACLAMKAEQAERAKTGKSLPENNAAYSSAITAASKYASGTPSVPAQGFGEVAGTTTSERAVAGLDGYLSIVSMHDTAAMIELSPTGGRSAMVTFSKSNLVAFAMSILEVFKAEGNLGVIMQEINKTQAAAPAAPALAEEDSW